MHVVWVGRGVGFHTMFLPDLVFVFFHLAALCTFVFACGVRPFNALFRIFNILGVHPSTPMLMLTLRGWCGVYGFSTYLLALPLFPHALWPSHTLCFFFCFFCRHVPRGARSLWRNGDIWVWFLFVRMLYDVRCGLLFVFASGVVPLAPSFTTYLVSSGTHV